MDQPYVRHLDHDNRRTRSRHFANHTHKKWKAILIVFLIVLCVIGLVIGLWVGGVFKGKDETKAGPAKNEDKHASSQSKASSSSNGTTTDTTKSTTTGNTPASTTSSGALTDTTSGTTTTSGTSGTATTGTTAAPSDTTATPSATTPSATTPSATTPSATTPSATTPSTTSNVTASKEITMPIVPPVIAIPSSVDPCVPNWYYNRNGVTPSTALDHCASPDGDDSWCMIPGYVSGGTEGVNWKYTEDPNDPACLRNWTYYDRNGNTIQSGIATITNRNDTKNWCALNVYLQGSLQSKAWQYCNTCTSTQAMCSSVLKGTNNRSCKAQMQKDGNLVVYNAKGTAVWSSGTNGRGTGPYKYRMQPDGNLVVYDSKNSPLWASNTAGKGPYYVRMQDDCNLVVYDLGDNSKPLWASNTFGKNEA